MPTKRVKRNRHLRERIPAWVEAMLAEGRPPSRESGGFDGFIGWKFFNEHVAGLPDVHTPEGKRLAANLGPME